MEKPRFSLTKRRRPNEKCTPSVRLAHLCEEDREDDHQHQIATRPLHRGGLTRSSEASQSPSHFSDRRGHTDCSRQRSYLLKRQVHGGRARCAADSSLSRTKCTVFQRLNTVGRAQETAPAPDWFVGRVGGQQCVGEFGANSAGSFRQPIHVVLSCAYSWNPRNARVG